MRYLGSKVRLLTCIQDVIDKYNIQGDSFADLFSGTGCVGDFFKDKYNVISNDFLYYSYIMSKAKLLFCKKPVFGNFDKKYKMDIFEWLNAKETLIKSTQTPKNVV